MFLKKLNECHEFTANDGCMIRELLHPHNDPVDPGYSIAFARIKHGGRTIKHQLKQSEVYYILSGPGCMHINDDFQLVESGDIIFVPSNAVQWIENKGNTDLQFLAIVSPPWQKQDDIRLE